MRFRLLLITMLFIPYVVKGQDGVVFYSEGKMHIGEGTEASPVASKSVLYVSGSMKFGSSDLNQSPAVATTQRTILTGDLVNALNPDHGENHLFSGTGELFFGLNTPLSTDEWADLTGGITPYTFNGLDASLQTSTEIYPRVQRIISAYDFTTAQGLGKIKEQKRKNYLNINKVIAQSTSRSGGGAGLHYVSTYLKLDPSASIKTTEVNIQRAAFFEVGSSSYDIDSRQYIHTGYAQVDAYKIATIADIDRLEKSNFVHRLTLFAEGGDNKYPETPAAGDTQKYFLTGFTPLFKGLGADYMFFNTLTEPGYASVTSWKGTITDPNYTMTSGTGYFMSSTAFQDDYQNILDNHFGGVSLGSGQDLYSDNRAKHEYVFNRLLMVQDQSKQQRFNKKTTKADTYNATSEIFNAADVKVNLKPGFNFLGNPFTAPLDLKDIVSVGAETKIVPGFNVNVSGEASAKIAGIQNKYWVVNKATVKQDPTTTGWYEYTLSFYDAQTTGGTADGKNGNATGEFHVAPMQMFLVQAGSLCVDNPSAPNCVITLPYSKTTLGSGAISPRSGKVSAQSERIDEFMLETTDLDNQTADRLSVVLRDNASLMDTDPTDTHKALKKTEKGRWLPTMEGTIYTRSSNDRPMLTNTVPTSTKQLAMYITPPTDKTRNMVIQPYRMETMSTVSRVWLEDKFENKIVELTPETKYYFSSPVLAEEDATKNRFVLHFAPVDNEDLVVSEDPIACYYNTSTLYISGLNEKDLNSNVQIYDLQGRMIGKTVVNTVGRMEYLKPLPQGTYIVKITGKRNYTTKFVNLQN